MEWWKARDEKVTSEDRRDARERGCWLGPVSYRRSFVCPFCGDEAATETFRDQYLYGGRPAKRVPSVEFRCKKCRWGALAGPRQFAAEIASAKTGWDRGHIVVLGAAARTAGTPSIRTLTVGGRRVWRRTAHGRHQQPDTRADYQTLTQAATASAEQHQELARVQALLRSPPKMKVLFP
jgi:predicted RNA-binding Zn-ribbon protein involved in translation (DUF1610 family)